MTEEDQDRTAGNSGAPDNQSGEPSIMELIKKVQRHIGFLDKKIDQLIAGGSGQSHDRRPSSRPFRPGGGYDRRPPQRREGNFSDRPNFNRDRPFNRNDSGPRRDFGDRPRRPFPRRGEH